MIIEELTSEMAKEQDCLSKIETLKNECCKKVSEINKTIISNMQNHINELCFPIVEIGIEENDSSFSLESSIDYASSKEQQLHNDDLRFFQTQVYDYIENDYDEATLNKIKDSYVKSFIRFEADLQKCKERIKDNNKILEKEKDAVIKEYELKIKAIEEMAK